jgi:hypothetical protein
MTVDEAWCGDSLLVFDGRVLEVFGFSGSESIRFHVRNMDLVIADADRKGRRSVRVKPASRGSGGVGLEVEEADWPAVGPFLDRVLAAIPDV